jgi:hypothetical protein
MLYILLNLLIRLAEADYISDWCLNILPVFYRHGSSA